VAVAVFVDRTRVRGVGRKQVIVDVFKACAGDPCLPGLNEAHGRLAGLEERRRRALDERVQEGFGDLRAREGGALWTVIAQWLSWSVSEFPTCSISTGSVAVFVFRISPKTGKGRNSEQT